MMDETYPNPIHPKGAWRWNHRPSCRQLSWQSSTNFWEPAERPSFRVWQTNIWGFGHLQHIRLHITLWEHGLTWVHVSVMLSHSTEWLWETWKIFEVCPQFQRVPKRGHLWSDPGWCWPPGWTRHLFPLRFERLVMSRFLLQDLQHPLCHFG